MSAAQRAKRCSRLPHFKQDNAEIIRSVGLFRLQSDGLLELGCRIDWNAESDECAGDRATAVASERHVLPQVACSQDSAEARHHRRLHASFLLRFLARRHRGRKGPSSPPRQCIRCDFDIVSVGEGSQDTSGEGAHSRRQAEQWGGIEGDPQCSHVSYDGRWCGRP